MARRRVTIVGAGPGGYVAAVRAAQLGGEVTLIESQEVGGVCLNKGCIPSKALIYGAEMLALMRRAEEFGVLLSGEARADVARMVERKRKVVQIQVKGIHALLKSWGVRYLLGRGRLESDRSVRVTAPDGAEQVVVADRIVIATGSTALQPALFPFDGETVITSAEALEPKTLPARLTIVGGGVEGCEFACLYRALGSDVTLIELKPRLLPLEDEEISAYLEREMHKQGIEIRTGAQVQSVAVQGGQVTVTLADGATVASDRLLVSIGRRPNTTGLGLDAVGITPGQRGEIPANTQLETAAAGVYAIGDVLGRIMLAHVASSEGKLAVANALGDGPGRAMDYAVVPAGIFTLPEIGTVGLKEWEARARGIPVRAGKFLYRALGRSHTMGEVAGLFKIVSDPATDRILGAHLIGAHAAELVHELALAMRLGATAAQVGEMIHAHPTLAEGVMEAAEESFGHAIHVPRKPGAAA